MPPYDGDDGPPSGSRTNRWTVDDIRRDEYWKGFYDRRRLEREKDWVPEYRGPQRYIEMDDERTPARGLSYRGSRREVRPPAAYRGRRSVDDGMGPAPRRHAEPDYEDDEDDNYTQYRGQGRQPPRPPPPPRTSVDSAGEALRLPLTAWMNKNVKGHFVATMGEFVGTTMFLFFAFAGTQVANVGGQNKESSTTGGETGFSPEVLLYIALVFGFSLMVNVWVFFRISGGLFNPAVTLAMAMTRAISVFRSCLLVTAQIGGSIFASFLVQVLFPTDFKVRTTLSPGTSLVQGVFIEAVLTFELVFTIFMLAKEKTKATFIAPVGIGLALFVAELVGVFYTGGSLNPARSFGPCVVTGIFDKEHWIYWVGPATGAIAAVLFYKFIKILEYEMANPGQDAASDEAADEAERRAKMGEASTNV
ncbi:aquaporin-like protein [Tothia fuscella]|uniref:Aquaporin-like protein n=1 Tax=Tothia fuscella TaxID=1048955 RepID=A0A9P4NRR5_9PEZI|nr:aquaporin-like protein [Tothia fuscella]